MLRLDKEQVKDLAKTTQVNENNKCTDIMWCDGEIIYSQNSDIIKFLID